jgi:tetratricopeptide (TPR) repeat protein
MNYLMKKLCLILFSFLIIAAPLFAQKLTKEQLVEKANKIYESGKQKEAIDLLDEYPEYADEVGVLYVKSVAYTELRDYKNADDAFQKGFDIFLKNSAETLTIADEYLQKPSVTKEEKEIAALMYSTTMIMFASADLTNSLRKVAFEKNGMPEAGRDPKNLSGFEDFRKTYLATALKLADLNAQSNKSTEAIENYTKAVELDPKNSTAYAGRAKVYRKLRKLKLAISDESNAKRYAAKK